MSENRHGFHQQSRSTIDDHQATHRLHLLQSFQAAAQRLSTDPPHHGDGPAPA
jgi:hypothetical protein